jgi:hypothetical protein
MAAFCEQEITNARTQSVTWTEFIEAVKGAAGKQGVNIKSTAS